MDFIHAYRIYFYRGLYFTTTMESLAEAYLMFFSIWKAHCYYIVKCFKTILKIRNNTQICSALATILHTTHMNFSGCCINVSLPKSAILPSLVSWSPQKNLINIMISFLFKSNAVCHFIQWVPIGWIASS